MQDERGTDLRAAEADREETGAALSAKGIQTLACLRRARAAAPRNPNLTAPEWELLGRFGLNSVEAVRRRMGERALLAAYDGAPAALMETLVERAESPARDGRGSANGRPRGETRRETLLETTLCYEPDAGRVRVEYAMTRRQVAVDESGQCQETRDGEFYAVAFDTGGGVVWREWGALRRVPGIPVARRDVTVEVAPR